MQRIGRTIISLASVTLVATFNVSAFAAPLGKKSVTINYRAIDSCPNRSAFVKQLTQRLPETTFLNDRTTAYEVALELELVVDRYVGHVRYADAAGQPAVRTLAAATCEELAQGLALVVALALEALVNGTETPPIERSQESDASAATPPEEPTSFAQRPTAEPPSHAPQAPTAGVQPTPTPRVASLVHPQTAPRAPKNQSLGILSGVDTAISPQVSFTVGAEWDYYRREGQPLLRFAAAWTSDRLHPRQIAGLGESRFELLAFHAQLCTGSRISHHPLTAMNFCGGVELGRYVAEGQPTSGSAASGFEVPMFWGAASLEPEFRVVMMPFYLGLGPTLTLPLLRRQFATKNPTTVVHEIPSMALGATFCAGMIFR